ncbi:MAG: glycoside hydrolase family 88 protein [Myxococcales bacterium]|nr:glycoside hydrolase family 88 protein [Myxococcales bacterium]
MGDEQRGRVDERLLRRRAAGWLLAGDDAARVDAARRWTAPLEVQAFNRLNHDVGFKIMPTFGAAARASKGRGDRRLVAAGADALASRFDPDVGCTRSWSHGEWSFPVIIDNMMNLEILLWAASAGLDGDRERWRMVAVAHADRTAMEHLRADGTSYHLVDYDPETGAVIARMTHQGAADESTWARGQAWALYGFTMVHRFTGEARHLDAARRAADAFLMRLGDDAVPYWDFDAPDIPEAPRDASAAAVAASGLLELSAATGELRYHDAAVRMLAALGAPPYLAPAGPSVLLQSVGHYPEQSEVSVPLVYADYYYVEALSRYRALRRGEPLPE